jgi:hypothetical protein
MHIIYYIIYIYFNYIHHFPKMTTTSLFETDSNAEEVFWLYNRGRERGTAYDFRSSFSGMKHSQHHYSHTVPVKVMLTNNFFNVRTRSNGFAVTVNNTTTGVSAVSAITVPAKHYETIASLQSTIQTSLSAALTATVASLSVGGSASSTISLTVDNETAITFTVTGTSDAYTFQIIKSTTALQSTLANDVEQALGFVDSQNRFSSSAAHAAIQTSTHTVDLNHIRFVRVFTDMGNQQHGGILAVVPIHGTVRHGFEEVDLYGGSVGHHAFPLRQYAGSQVHVRCTDVNGDLLEGKGHVTLLFKLYRKATRTEYGKRIRLQ